LQYTSTMLGIIKLPELSLFVKDDLLWTFCFGVTLRYFSQIPVLKNIFSPSLKFNVIRRFTTITEHAHKTGLDYISITV